MTAVEEARALLRGLGLEKQVEEVGRALVDLGRTLGGERDEKSPGEEQAKPNAAPGIYFTKDGRWLTGADVAALVEEHDVLEREAKSWRKHAAHLARNETTAAEGYYRTQDERLQSALDLDTLVESDEDPDVETGAALKRDLDESIRRGLADMTAGRIGGPPPVDRYPVIEHLAQAIGASMHDVPGVVLPDPEAHRVARAALRALGRYEDRPAVAEAVFGPESTAALAAEVADYLDLVHHPGAAAKVRTHWRVPAASPTGPQR